MLRPGFGLQTHDFVERVSSKNIEYILKESLFFFKLCSIFFNCSRSLWLLALWTQTRNPESVGMMGFGFAFLTCVLGGSLVSWCKKVKLPSAVESWHSASRVVVLNSHLSSKADYVPFLTGCVIDGSGRKSAEGVQDANPRPSYWPKKLFFK